MSEDKMIILADDTKYGILLESELTEKTYYLAVLLNEQEEPTQNFAVLEEIIKDGEEYVQKINDPLILNELLEDFNLQYEEEFGEESNQSN